MLVALSPSSFTIGEPKGKAPAFRLEMGQTKWVGASKQQKLENTGSAPAELLRFDFKTKPLSKDVLENDKKHEHQKE